MELILSRRADEAAEKPGQRKDGGGAAITRRRPARQDLWRASRTPFSADHALADYCPFQRMHLPHQGKDEPDSANAAEPSQREVLHITTLSQEKFGQCWNVIIIGLTPNDKLTTGQTQKWIASDLALIF